VTATLREGWKMPSPPVEGAVPAYYNDGSEIWLHWTEDTEEHLPIESDGGDISWPFVEEQALHTDLEALGFVNTDA